MLARSISRWLTISASAGTSFCVAMKNLEVFMGAREALSMLVAYGKIEKRILLWLTQGGAAHARQGRLPSERRHHPRQSQERGVLGQAGPSARLAISPRRHPARRDSVAGHVSGAGGRNRPAACARAHPRPYARLAAL